MPTVADFGIHGRVDPELLAGIVAYTRAMIEAGNAAEGAGTKSQKSSSAVASMAASAATFAVGANAVIQFGQTVVAAAGQVADLAAEQERLDRMSARLGLNFDEAAGAAGRFTDEVDVMNTAGAFAARGINLTQTELNAMTHAAARNAQATGVEMPQALESLQRALLSGRERALAPFGQELAATARHGYSAGEGIAAMVEQERHMETATDDAHTSMLGFNDALGDAARGFATLATRGLGLDGVVAGLVRRIGQLSSDLRALNDPLQTTEGRAANDDRNAAMSEYAAARAAMRAQLERGGGDLSTLPGIDVANQTPAQLRNQAAALRDISGRAGGNDGRGGGILIGGVDPLAAPIELDTRAAERELRALRDQVTTERTALATAAAEADAANDEARRTVGRRADGGANAAAAAERRAEHRNGQLLLAEFRDYATQRRAAEHLLAEDLARDAEVRQGNERFSRDRMRAANDNHAGKSTAAGRFVAADMTTAVNADQFQGQALDKLGSVIASGATGALGEQGDSMADQLAQKERDRLETSVSLHESYTGRLAELNSERVHGLQRAAEFTNGAFETMGKAIGTHVQALIDGKESVGQALQGMLADTLINVGKEAIIQGGIETAKGIAALAGVATAPLAPGHFAAAGAFFAVGTAAGLAGAAIAPSAPAAGAGAGRGGAGGLLPDRAAAGGESAGPSVVNNYYAPVIGGRTAGEGESGMQINRLTNAEARRTRRAA